MKSIKKNLKHIPINQINNKILSYSNRMDLTSQHLRMEIFYKLLYRNRLLDAVQHQMIQDLHQVEALHKLLILKVVN